MEINKSRVRLFKTMTFLRMISRTYGAEKSAEVWAKISKILDDDELTMGVMTTMLNGGYGSSDFTITSWIDDGTITKHGASMKVAAIKMLRQWTLVGLKESKDAIDAAQTGQSSQFKIHIKQDEDGNQLDIEYGQFEKDMRSVGITVELE